MLKFLLLTLLFTSAYSQVNKGEVDYYEKLIKKANSDATFYRHPSNAKEYFSKSKIKNFNGDYDFVIIGSGAAGSVAARYLSDADIGSILVLEMGKTWGNNFTDIPNMFIVSHFTNLTRQYPDVKQKTACLGMEGGSCPYLTGNGIGGSSLINGMIYTRGFKNDFTIWSQKAKCDRWNWTNSLDQFKKLENFVHRDPQAPYQPKYHGEGGPLETEFHLPRHPLLETMLAANEELGYKAADVNANELGASPLQQNTKNGRRQDDGKAFLLPVKNRENLKILTGSYVTKIRISRDSKIARGVEFAYDGQNYYVDAKKEVILSAGAIKSPHILMLSGVGPKSHLRKIGIEVIEDLSVGNNLHDTGCVPLAFSTNVSFSGKSLRDNIKLFLNPTNSTGPLTSIGLESIGFYRSSYTEGTDAPGLEFEIIPPPDLSVPLTRKYLGLSWKTFLEKYKKMVIAGPDKAFSVMIDLVNAVSVGDVRLKSKNPHEYPRLNSNMLSDPENQDIDSFYEGIQLAMKFIQTESFQKIGAKPLDGRLSACRKYEFLSKDYWYCFIRQVSGHRSHSTGTCSMGSDPEEGAVVDCEMRVFGVERLRVADASIIPLPISGHSHAACNMIGAQLAELLIEQYKKN